MKNFEKSHIRVAKAPRFPQFIVRSGVPEKLPNYNIMDNLKNPYLSPCITRMMLFSLSVIAASSTADDSLSDFDENNPTWTID